MTESSKRSRGRPRAFHDKTDQNTIKSLDRALAILATLSETDSLSLSELADRANQPAATVYRVLTTFARHDIVNLNNQTQLWRIGPGAFRIGSRFLRQNNLLENCRPIMHTLMLATNETANLGVENRDQVLFVSQSETHQTIRAFFPPGTRNPMHSSGIGKALLAEFPPDRVAGIVERMGLQRFTDNTITDPNSLSEELEKTRQQGYAFDDEERTEGMRCVAAAVFDPFGNPVAGLSVSGPSFRVPRNAVPELGARVKAAANDLTHAIGGANGRH
ncbi:IclR family transcriptional regulator [Alisedimentitalea sp. MJ-SS2]|uniref:HTH-type transcriptional regulator BhcR n=1 Tax=Aliisedimentitalea sp. MJ-SS2 TaxID=3049795 RepID=UPI0029093312|nr:HTH-type transcriptional regulator BhcR [Alisedimentitalea sp. MJ-SS2]MDU8927082.1 IclR family transcriptional regulator [Alisedimentitalea sp. MJ-SS2]